MSEFDTDSAELAKSKLLDCWTSWTSFAEKARTWMGKGESAQHGSDDQATPFIRGVIGFCHGGNTTK